MEKTKIRTSILGIVVSAFTSIIVAIIPLYYKHISSTQNFKCPEFYYIDDGTTEKFICTVALGSGELIIHPQLEIVYKDRYVIRLVNLENICQNKIFQYNADDKAFTKQNNDKESMEAFGTKIGQKLMNYGMDNSQIKINIVYIVQLNYNKTDQSNIETFYYLLRNGQVTVSTPKQLSDRSKEFDVESVNNEEQCEIIVNDCLKNIIKISTKDSEA